MPFSFFLKKYQQKFKQEGESPTKSTGIALFSDEEILMRLMCSLLYT